MLTVKTSNVLKAFRNADKSGKQLLSDLFDKELFDQKITDRVNSFEDALELDGEQPEEIMYILNYKGTNKDMLAQRSLARLTIGIRVLNEGVKKDYNNNNQAKYEPYFNLSSSGSGFSCANYDDWAADSHACSRLAYVSLSLMHHGVKIFFDDYKTYFNE